MMQKIIPPNKVKIIESKNNRAVFEIEACCPGYGLTLGNAFRRVLLSSLPGAAAVGVKIKGIQHEFSAVPHCLEDVVQLILNLKQVRFKLYTNQPTKAFLKVRGEKEVKAGDIKTTAELEVVNKETHIATLTDKKANLEMEIDVELGLGYSPAEQRQKKKLEIGHIAIDAIFSPVRKVLYSVGNMRVGERTDYDLLKIDIETDGTIKSEEALHQAAGILVEHFGVFTKIGLKEEKKKKIIKKLKTRKKKSEGKEKKPKEDLGKIKIEELKLSPRVASLLEKTGIKTISGLARKGEGGLNEIEGLGKKGIREIKRALGKLGLILK